MNTVATPKKPNFPKRPLTSHDIDRCCREGCGATRFQHEYGPLTYDHEFQEYDWNAFQRAHIAYLDWQAGTRGTHAG